MQSPNLKQITVDEVVTPPNQQVLVADSRANLPEAFQLLVNNNIYSAPVQNMETGEYLGFIDVLDLLTYIVDIVEKTGPNEETDLWKLLRQGNMFSATKVASVVDFSKRDAFCPVVSGSPLLKAMEIMSRAKVHRIPIIDHHHKKVIAVLTQSAIVRYLVKHRELFAHLQDKTIRELSLGFKSVVSIGVNKRAFEAFKLMKDEKISAVAVLNPNGTLLTNISAKDIKAMRQDVVFTKLYKTVGEYVAATRADEINAKSPSIVCRPDDKLGLLLERFAVTGIHRIYIVDDNHKAIGVISLGDIISLLVEEGEVRILK